MNRSTDRILTTHVGSLAQPPELTKMIRARDRGEMVNMPTFENAARIAVMEVVAKQVETGLTVVNDGEMSKSNYTNYVSQRMSGLGIIQKEVTGGSEIGSSIFLSTQQREARSQVMLVRRVGLPVWARLRGPTSRKSRGISPI